ncbi:MAG: hypothetical protein J7K84_08215 [Deltaproteobacteria bacterium]|nr:hypothetical protein [Deltaproteobacteria bacterium]
MTNNKDTILINANIEIPITALQTIVANAKKIAGKNEKGHYQIDTADKVSEMISRFLVDNDFESYAKNMDNFLSESA